MEPTSLSLLLPRSSIPSFPPTSTSSTRYLEEQATKIALALEPANSDNPGYNLIDPAHVSEFLGDGQPPERSFVGMYGREELLRHRAFLKILNPGVNLEVIDVTSKVNEGNGLATVYLTCRLSDYSSINMKPRESVAILEWKRFKDRGWICIKSKFLHGYPNIPASHNMDQNDELL